MSKKQISSMCKLCKTEQILIGSHIIPKFLHKKIDPNRNTPFVVYENLKAVTKNDLGIAENLLCKKCDNEIIGAYEKYFNDIWYVNSVLPNTINQNEIISIVIDYKLFLLFHLSVFWRMSVSNDPSFQHIDFGKRHNEQIRTMLLNNDDSNNLYKITVKIIEKDKQLLDKIIMQPVHYKVDLHNIYSAIYGGLEIKLKISSHYYEEFEKVSMSNNKTCVFVRNYKDISQLQEASLVLQKVRDKSSFT